MREAIIYITGINVYLKNNEIFTYGYQGTIIEEMAKHYSKVFLCAPQSQQKGNLNYRFINRNIILLPIPFYEKILDTIPKVFSFFRAYLKIFKNNGVVFARGIVPFVSLFYFFSIIHGKKPVYWVVGDPERLLLSHIRGNPFYNFCGLCFAFTHRKLALLGRFLTHGAFICTGKELAEKFSSSKTFCVVSSPLVKKSLPHFEERPIGTHTRLLYVGYVRPEKGLQFLLYALGFLDSVYPGRFSLSIVGSWDKHSDYKKTLDTIIEEKNLVDQVVWKGYVEHGKLLWKLYRSHDILVLPSLSEGIPFVLLEAMANSLPIIATRVGGVPTIVKHMETGILVKEKNPNEIKDAVVLLTTDVFLRREVIRNGYLFCKNNTVEDFVNFTIKLLDKQ